MNWFLIFLVSHLSAPPDKSLFVSNLTAEPTVDYVLANFVETNKRNQVRGAEMSVNFAANLPKLDRNATLDARRFVSPNGEVRYEVTHSDGDSAIKKEVIARYMSAEMEPPAQMPTDIAITPENYKFKSKGVRDFQERKIYVFEVVPRKKRLGLFKGEIWVDSETGLTLREAGRLSKSPSVFLKDVDFIREFRLQDGFSVPQRIETNMQTRFWGRAQLIVYYSDFNWQGGLSAQATDATQTPQLVAH